MVQDWDALVREESGKDYFVALRAFVAAERAAHTVHPPDADVMAALEATPLRDVRVVILGQDPYHGAGQANGLAFSVRRGVRTPPSLRNIHRELQSDLGIEAPAHGDLARWSHNGVLLLNTTLTVREGEAGSHSGHGWETFTDAVITALDSTERRIVFLLWGAHAQRKKALIRNTVHSVIESAHPSPLSAHRGFLGSRPFSRCNDALREADLPPVDWHLD